MTIIGRNGRLDPASSRVQNPKSKESTEASCRRSGRRRLGFDEDDEIQRVVDVHRTFFLQQFPEIQQVFDFEHFRFSAEEKRRFRHLGRRRETDD